jgi:putative nucleotide binding protein
MKMIEKEEHAIILDYLPYGYPLEKKMMPIAQAIGVKKFTLLQLIPRRGIKLEVGEDAYIGEGKRDKIYYILGRLPEDKLTETAKQQLGDFIEKEVTGNQKKFVDFFNNATAINTRIHQFELLPGFGRKHTEAIITERNKKPFESLEDLKERVSNLPDPKKAVEKRLMEEIVNKQKYYLFISAQ